MPIEAVDVRVTDFLATPTWLASVGGATALVAGLSGSAHCALMCGPLSCGPLPLERRARARAAVAWHAGRLGAYALVGAGLGSVGQGAASLLRGQAAGVLPWVMAAALIATGFDVGKRLPALPGLGRVSHAVARWCARFSPTVRAGAWGAVTPLLPCGLLYGVFVAAVATGRAWTGALVMVAFGLGGVPALAAVQAHARLLTGHPRALAVAKRVVPLLAAAVLVWRALGAGAAGDVPRCH